MGARLVILIAVAVGLGVFFVMKPAKKPGDSGSVADEGVHDPLSEEDRKRIDLRNKRLDERDLPGEEPNPKPQLSDFEVRTEVNTAGGKNQLCFYITEAHGYYVESLRLQFWYTGADGKLGESQSPLSRQAYVNNYIKSKDTLKYCMEVVPAELDQAGGALGTSTNWAARVVWYNRSRAKNPDPLPEL